ncbi:DUF4349 domain-containing protein [Microbacterium betulae]|uniref:DUF4349 domain-containing protein n=1 Tax=Microbacterium betulae TaxID=2981139 RepID=A0AA97I3N1_9MICO|nr:DUF4349 domain-containing protein [Microbacterium sp. AB]WOF21631.1 DUF4349 domain-containing protein [Microbacterium sp. AB]
MMNHHDSEADLLPDLPEEAVRRIEERVFSDIRDDRAQDRATSTPARRRRRVWPGIAAAAVAVVLAAAISPSVVSSISGSESTVAADDALTEPESAVGESAGSASDPDATTGEREVILTGDATLEVGDVRTAADAITALVEERGGRVDGLRIAADGDTADMSDVSTASSWISVRVPSSDLTTVVEELADVGDVVESQLSTQDVTSQAVDLRARIDAAQESVSRLTELMSQAGSVPDLLAAEQALSERQGQLESYQQELESLEGQVEMSSLTIALTTADTAAAPDPTGFGDGLLAGWNGLLATLNGIVVALGFLLPWLAVVGVVVLVLWLSLRARRRRARAAPPGPDRTVPTEDAG